MKKIKVTDNQYKELLGGLNNSTVNSGKKVVTEFTDAILSTIKDFNEERRLNRFTNFEKQIFFYQKGFNSFDVRFLKYVNDFRKYYFKTNEQTTRNLSNKEIATFLTKHYYSDIKPNIDNEDIIFKDGENTKSLFPKFELIWMSNLRDINRDFNNPDIHSESIESKEKILYSAVVLDEDSRDKLLTLVRSYVEVPENWAKLAHHMTIIFKEGLPPELKNDLNKNVTLTVKTIGISDDAIAVGVEGYPTTKDTPHITLAIPPNGKPGDSNNIEDWKDIKDTILLQGKVSEIITNL